MIVCHCRGVTDSEIRSAVRQGACTREEIARCCGAGAACGGCVPAVVQIALEERQPSGLGFRMLEMLPAAPRSP